jgi:hypothetical protein
LCCALPTNVLLRRGTIKNTGTIILLLKKLIVLPSFFLFYPKYLFFNRTTLISSEFC